MKKKIVVLSGLAGAGKSTAARALEDLGFFVVDNLPPPLGDSEQCASVEQPQRFFLVSQRLPYAEPLQLSSPRHSTHSPVPVLQAQSRLCSPPLHGR